ncbi:uncharacterized protein BJ212DRAFT_1444309 [Suillus subaureus]|uniref:Uncharacterized protein n=1 Tax=Suillus subaureus TaxID=48587 RepID=A0A9P7JIK5_9AGAM|nr:uncharacterized protein BJ212DRAFT_1444309 [Suillus subaureus]KAG1824457.1 hypothetical protein BJ212DRAFT_1444309 [Suillus subaureus]
MWYKHVLEAFVLGIAVVVPFTGLQKFPDGCGFKQWMGNNSKALMKVFILAIKGHIPQDMMHAFRVLLEFCYIAWRNIITETSLDQLKDALAWFHHYHQIFKTTGTHIKAVKQPWRWSSKHNTIGQMLLANQRLDKLTASHVDFTACAMLIGSVLSRAVAALHNEVVDGLTVLLSFVKLARTPSLADEVNIPYLPCLIHYFLLHVFNSATVTFYVSSDPSSISGMQQEQIHACPLWWNVYAYLEGMKGLEVARVRFFFPSDTIGPPCIHVLLFIGSIRLVTPNEDTGMWIICPSVCDNGTPNLTVIHIKTIYDAVHLIPVYGPDFIPNDIEYSHCYDAFCLFYVNKYTDYHAFKVVS